MPGKDIGYRSMVPGDKPHVEPGVGFPESLKWFLEFIIQTFDTISKLNAVLMGAAAAGRPDARRGGDPAGARLRRVPGAARAARRLREAAVAEAAVDRAAVRVGAALPADARRERRLGAEAFTGADLEGHVTLDIELASAWPKSPMLTNLRVCEGARARILNPQDPEVQEEYLRLNDLQSFKQSTDVDTEQIARQLEIWRQATDPQQIEPPQAWWRLDMHAVPEIAIPEVRDVRAPPAAAADRGGRGGDGRARPAAALRPSLAPGRTARSRPPSRAAHSSRSPARAAAARCRPRSGVARCSRPARRTRRPRTPAGRRGTICPGS
jgi:hypothetical protein